MLLIGSGLVLFGLVAYLVLPKPGDTGLFNSAAGSDASAIPVTVNFPAPLLELSDLNGKAVSLADYRGQYVLVNNWATWCPPCKAEMPVLQAYYDDHRHQNFTLIAIESGEPVDIVTEFVKVNGLRFTVWPDPDEKVYQAFRNISLPASWLIDPQGQVRLTWTGAINRSTLEKYITPILEE